MDSMEQNRKNQEQDAKIKSHDQDIHRLEGKIDRLLTYIDSDKNTGRKGMFELYETMQDDFTKFRLEFNQRLTTLEEIEKIKLAKRTAAKAFWLGLGGFIMFVIAEADQIGKWIKHFFKIYP